jgi:hypothetical protein
MRRFRGRVAASGWAPVTGSLGDWEVEEEEEEPGTGM